MELAALGKLHAHQLAGDLRLHLHCLERFTLPTARTSTGTASRSAGAMLTGTGGIAAGPAAVRPARASANCSPQAPARQPK